MKKPELSRGLRNAIDGRYPISYLIDKILNEEPITPAEAFFVSGCITELIVTMGNFRLQDAIVNIGNDLTFNEVHIRLLGQLYIELVALDYWLKNNIK